MIVKRPQLTEHACRCHGLNVDHLAAGIQLGRRGRDVAETEVENTRRVDNEVLKGGDSQNGWRKTDRSQLGKGEVRERMPVWVDAASKDLMAAAKLSDFETRLTL